MNTTLHTYRTAILAGLGVVLGTASCTTKPEAKDNWQDPFFSVNHSVAPTRTILDRSAEAGGAQDAMLHPVHFDGDRVNSLGDAKLRAMLAGRAANEPMTVYLNFPTASTRPATQPTATDRLAEARRANVDRYLAELGVVPGDAIVVIGANAAANGPVDAGVLALQPVSVAAPAAH